VKSVKSPVKSPVKSITKLSSQKSVPPATDAGDELKDEPTFGPPKTSGSH
jgi:hypothetical protein